MLNEAISRSSAATRRHASGLGRVSWTLTTTRSAMRPSRAGGRATTHSPWLPDPVARSARSQRSARVRSTTGCAPAGRQGRGRRAAPRTSAPRHRPPRPRRGWSAGVRPDASTARWLRRLRRARPRTLASSGNPRRSVGWRTGAPDEPLDLVPVGVRQRDLAGADPTQQRQLPQLVGRGLGPLDLTGQTLGLGRGGPTEQQA